MGAALGFIILVLWNTRSVTAATSILIVTVSLNAAVHLGFLTNHLDLSPNFCGTLMGLTNSLSSIASIVAPLTVGWMVTDTVCIISFTELTPSLISSYIFEFVLFRIQRPNGITYFF